MKKQIGNLSDRQQVALPHFIAATSITAACTAAKITTKTYYEWINTTDFGRVLEEERSKLREEAYSVMKANLPRAAETLIALLDAENESVKRMAANDILTHVNTHFEMQEVEKRLKSLEERL